MALSVDSRARRTGPVEMWQIRLAVAHHHDAHRRARSPVRTGSRNGPAGTTLHCRNRFAIDDDQRQILRQRKILMAVVHDDDVGAMLVRQRRARRAVARDDGRRGAREQQWLVADFACAMFVRDRPASGPRMRPP